MEQLTARNTRASCNVHHPGIHLVILSSQCINAILHSHRIPSLSSLSFSYCKSPLESCGAILSRDYDDPLLGMGAVSVLLWRLDDVMN